MNYPIGNFSGLWLKNWRYLPFWKLALLHFETPTPSTKGIGHWILAILQKRLKISQFACAQNFKALSSKLRISLILKIGPIALLNPPGTKGGGYWILANMQKKS